MGIPSYLRQAVPSLTCMQVKNQQLEPDMEKQTGSKLGNEFVKAVYCHPAYLTSMQSTSGEMPRWMKHKLESRFQEKYRPPQICRWYHFKGRKWKGTKEPLDKSERGEWKAGLKLNIQKTKIMTSGPHHFMANRWGNNGNSGRFYFPWLQNHWRWWLQPWN